MSHEKALRPRKALKCRMKTFGDLEKHLNVARKGFATPKSVKMSHEKTLRGRKSLKCRMMN